jgi:hypothetical protein
VKNIPGLELQVAAMSGYSQNFLRSCSKLQYRKGGIIVRSSREVFTKTIPEVELQVDALGGYSHQNLRTFL